MNLARELKLFVIIMMKLFGLFTYLLFKYFHIIQYHVYSNVQVRPATRVTGSLAGA